VTNARYWFALRARVNETFAGITWPMIALLLGICVFDVFRDSLVVLFQLTPERYLRFVWRHLYPTVLMAILMLLAMMAAINRYPEPGWRQSVAIAAALLISCALGVLGKLYVTRWLFVKTGVVDNWFYVSPGAWFAWFFVRYTVLGALFSAVYVMYRRERQRLQALQQAELDQSRLRQQMDEAQLQALSAQIEPHFLFNTLANVRSLYQVDPVAASRVLENLVRYLGIALPRMRESESTIGREAALVDAFLGVHQTRMGERLRYSIDVPKDIAELPVPPMMLLTLVENAIKHGVGPQLAGGAIDVRAREEEGTLTIRVADTGRGFAKSLGGGTGLANIRARLAALFGTAARLRLAINEPTGVVATIALPARRAGT
jgi:signal transduction histidine kinase